MFHGEKRFGVSMRAWVIVLSSLVASIAAGAGLALLWLPLPIDTPAVIAPMLLPHLPVLALAVLASYALAALLLTTAILVGDLLRLRQHLVPLTQLRAPTGRDLVAAFGPSRLRPLAARLAATFGEPGEAGAAAGISDLIEPGEIRREVARLHYIWLARTQFVTALALLVLAGFGGIAQPYEPALALPGPIPAMLAWLAVAGLVILAGMSRMAIDVAAEPVAELIARLPSEQLETRLLRRMTTLMRASTSLAPAPPKSPTRGPQLSDESLDRLARRIEGSRRAWVEAAAGLSAAAEALQATIRASVDAMMEASLHTATNRSPAGETTAVGFAELQGALERLTAQIEHLGAVGDAPGTRSIATEPVADRGGNSDQLAAELARLLREIEAKP